MTEAEWDTCTDPLAMLEFLRGRASDRKLRLLTGACCQGVRDVLDGGAREFVETVEREDPDGPIKLNDWAWAELAERIKDHSPSRTLIVQLPPWWGMKMALLSAQPEPMRRLLVRIASYRHRKANDTLAASRASPGDEVRAARAAWAKAQAAKADEQAFQSDMLREVFGNPFQPTTISPSWQPTKAVELAQSIYDSRAFDRLQLLADALEDAGCTDAAILAHCRGPGEHVRGCWVVDLLLGKS